MGIEITLENHIPAITKKIAETAKARMFEAANVVRTTTLETLTGPRTGRVYRIPGSIRHYTASAPGEPPAQRLGELRQSVSIEVKGEGEELVGRVGTPKEHGPMLEYGTKKMAARPWLRPSFEKSEDKVRGGFNRPW